MAVVGTMVDAFKSKSVAWVVRTEGLLLVASKGYPRKSKSLSPPAESKPALTKLFPQGDMMDVERSLNREDGIRLSKHESAKSGE